jgi:hypothetical protein
VRHDRRPVRIDVKGDADAAVWTSEDLVGWDADPDPALVGSGSQAMLTVVKYQDVYVAGGYSYSGRRSAGTRRSGRPDGTAWGRVKKGPSTLALRGDGGQAIRSLVVLRNASNPPFAFGVTGEGPDEDAQVWNALASDG